MIQHIDSLKTYLPFEPKRISEKKAAEVQDHKLVRVKKRRRGFQPQFTSKFKCPSVLVAGPEGFITFLGLQTALFSLWKERFIESRNLISEVILL